MLCLQDGQDTFRFAHLTFQDCLQPLRPEVASGFSDVSGVKMSGFEVVEVVCVSTRYI